MACGFLGYKCCPGSTHLGPDSNLCTRIDSKCVCYGFGHDIDPDCSGGLNDSPCCSDGDCAWKDNTHTGYCKDNKCIVWEKWPNDHTCSQASDCMSGHCSAGVCTDGHPSFPVGHKCDVNEDCASGLLCVGWKGEGVCTQRDRRSKSYTLP